MVAFARLGSAACQRLAPDVEGFHALVLLRLTKPPLTDKEIVAKEKELKRLRHRLGLSRWCRRYAGEMEQARILVEVLRRLADRLVADATGADALPLLAFTLSQLFKLYGAGHELTLAQSNEIGGMGGCLHRVLRPAQQS